MDKISVIITKDIEKISEDIKDSIEDFSLDKVVDIIPHLIKCVEKYKSLMGSEKKKLVIEIVKHFIDKTDGFGDDKVVDPILKSIVPSVIDNLIKVDKKQLKLKQKDSCVKKLLLCIKKT